MLVPLQNFSIYTFYGCLNIKFSYPVAILAGNSNQPCAQGLWSVRPLLERCEGAIFVGKQPKHSLQFEAHFTARPQQLPRDARFDVAALESRLKEEHSRRAVVAQRSR